MNRVLVLYIFCCCCHSPYKEYNKKDNTHKQAKSLNLMSKMCLWSIDDDVEKWIIYLIDDDCHYI